MSSPSVSSELSFDQAASASPSAGNGAPRISAAMLDNGMRILVIPDRRAPVVTHMVWYRNGSADDPVGKSGIAHFLEHLMFKGTHAHPAGEFSTLVAELGGQENAFTSFDYTAYYQRIAKEHLGVMMAYEADRMTGLVLHDDVVAPERDVVLEERRLRIESDPGAQLSEAMMAALYVRHPYGTPIIGWMNEIETLNRADALAYYGRFYTPENSTLVVAGDVEAEEVRALAEKTYGAVRSTGKTPVRQRPLEPEPWAARRVSVSDPKVEQPILQRLYLAPSSRLSSGLQSHALQILSETLGGGSTSRLYRQLAMNDGPAAMVGAHYDGEALDLTRFGIYAVPRAAVSLDELEKALDATLASFIEQGPTSQELQRAVFQLQADRIYRQDSQTALAHTYGAALSVDGSLDDVRLWPERIAQVTSDDVKAAAALVLASKRSVTGHLLRS